MNRILLDSSYLFSLYNPDDRNAHRSLAFAAQNRFHALVPDVAITEVVYLLRHRIGVHAVAYFTE